MAHQQLAADARRAVLAVILPITSRGSLFNDARANLERMKENLDLPGSARIYFGIDNDDRVYTESLEAFAETFHDHKVVVDLFLPTRPARICDILNKLVRRAYMDGCDYFVLLGDDVKITSCSDDQHQPRRRHWFELVIDRFSQTAEHRNLPFGVACVALNDTTAPGFPTFPIVHRRHVHAMGVAFCPSVFVNQDADPFVFEIYRRWAASSFLFEVQVTNEIGGVKQPPRYNRCHVDWKNEVLRSAVSRVQHAGYGVPSPTMVTIDVVIPTYRVNVDALRRILAIAQPEDVATWVFIIVDDPYAPQAEIVQQFEKEYLGRVRVRRMTANMGASAARNRGIEESTADWILFLDDDVEPASDILHHYSAAIKRRGLRTCGFVGLTSFPPVRNQISDAAYLSHTLFFWSISKRFPDQPVAWGVTANLVMRRTQVRFRMEFPKTGGGEDIAFCVDSQEHCELPLWSAVEARATHPWWESGRFNVAIRFFKWALGDGILLQTYPHLTYLTLPNVYEMTLFWAAIAPVLVRLRVATIPQALACLLWFWLVDIATDVCLCMTANVHVLPDLTGRPRIMAALASTVVKSAVEFGHVWTQVRRFKLFSLCHRFDWFVNLLPHEKKKQQRQSLIRFLWFTAPFLTYFSWLVTIMLLLYSILMQFAD